MSTLFLSVAMPLPLSRETSVMFAPITAPTFIQTVHGLTYKVVRTSQRDEKEDPQQSRKSNRIDANRIDAKRNPSAVEKSDGSQLA